MSRFIYLGIGVFIGVYLVRNTQQLEYPYQGMIWYILFLGMFIGWVIGKRYKNSAVAVAVATATANAHIEFEAKLKAQAQAMAQVNIIQQQLQEGKPVSSIYLEQVERLANEELEMIREVEEECDEQVHPNRY